MGFRNWKGQLFTSKKVITVRCAYKLKSRRTRLIERGFLTAEDLAKRFGVSAGTISQWGRAGLLRRERYDNNVRCLYAPMGSKMIQKGKGGRKPISPKAISARKS